MALLNLNERRPMGDENKRIFNAVEEYIEKNPNEYFDSFHVSQQVNEDRKTVNRALKRLEAHGAIVPATDEDGNVMHASTGVRGRPPVQYVLASDDN